MRRRSAVKTLLRVAELQEAVARGVAGRALAVTHEADQVHASELAHLSAAGLAGGTRQALETTTQIRILRAAAVAAAAAELEEAQRTQALAVQGWTESRRRHRLFEELATRQRSEALAQQEKTAQRLSDDLAGLRRSRP
jgi:flagellar biosynthesis chaperone FliJ